MERRMRIGELAERTHVSADALRAWERRYGLLRPERSNGGYRLYTSADEKRVLAMTGHVESGVPAGEAARLVLESGGDEVVGPAVAGLTADLREALDCFDDGGAQAAFDRLIAALSFETV